MWIASLTLRVYKWGSLSINWLLVGAKRPWAGAKRPGEKPRSKSSHGRVQKTAEDGALGTVVSPQSRFPQIKGILSRCSARANLTGFFHRKTMGTVMSCRRDKVTDKRYLDPIRESRSSLDNRKKGQLAQLVRESDLFFRVKRQIKTVLTSVVVERVKSRMSNAKTGQR